MYGQKFTDQWRGVDPTYLKSVWSEELASFSVDEIKRGLAACRTRPWPPTLPEFLSLSRPPIDPESAFIEAVRELRKRETNEDTWSHPAIFWATRLFATQDLMGMPYVGIKNRWTKALNEQLELGTWPEIPQRLIELPAPGQTAVDPAKVKQYLAELRERMSRPVGER
ncbi:MAG: hypothetical protein B7Y05_02880 [Polynucleobacter sp. 24-46-87]|jgi:hypothetical protein|nr:MAG: hypothetical protein B7Y05_02880 [Polynucleobacter sp. 24-46-87]